MEFYFDIETEGLNPYKDKVITVQYQGYQNGVPCQRLQILKEWDEGERDILFETYHLLFPDNPFEFIPIGINIDRFEFPFLYIRMLEHKLTTRTIWDFRQIPRIDLFPVMVLLNGGKFKGCTQRLKNPSFITNDDIPTLYHEKKYKMIESYVQKESKAFSEFYYRISEHLRMWGQ